MLNINEAADYLGLSPEELRKLVDANKIPAYQIGGVFLRFKKSQIEAVKQDIFSAPQPSLSHPEDYSFSEKLKDFLYFNDFYIISIIIILIVLIVIFM